MALEVPKGLDGMDPTAEKKDAAPEAYHARSIQVEEIIVKGAGVGATVVSGSIVVVVVTVVVVVLFVGSIVVVVEDVVDDVVVEEVVVEDVVVVVDDVVEVSVVVEDDVVVDVSVVEFVEFVEFVALARMKIDEQEYSFPSFVEEETRSRRASNSIDDVTKNAEDIMMT